MEFKIYQSEINDGLTKAIQANSTLAYITEAKPYKPSEKVKDKLVSLISTANTEIKQQDLFYINSVLVSVGWNHNDDVFTPRDTWLARATPVDKPFNYMHNEKDIIGHMTASIAVDKNGDIIDDDISLEDIPDQFDIVVASVLYKEWTDEKLQSRMDGIVEDIPNGNWFVSMECLFPSFDYALITPQGEHKVVARNEESAFLTKHLRIYGGSGEWNGNKLGRMLRGFSFCGKGLVDNPANERSVILSSAENFDTNVHNFNSNSTMTVNNDSQDNNEQEIAMSEALQAQINELKAELQTSKANEAQLVVDSQAKAEKAFKAEKETLEASIASLTSDIETGATEAIAKDTKVTELEKQIADHAIKLEEATVSIATLTQEKTDAGRLTKLVEAGVKSDEAQAIVERWTSASDEQFADIVKLHVDAFGHDDDEDEYKDKKDKKKDKDKDKDKGKGSETNEDSDPEGEAAANADLDDADVDADPNMATADEDVVAETRKAVASWLGDTVLNYSKPKNQK